MVLVHIVFITIFIFSLFSIDVNLGAYRKVCIGIAFIILVLFAGTRGDSGIDSIEYIDAFLNQTFPLFDTIETHFSFGSNLEVGYKTISTFAKTVTDDPNVFFIIISFLSMCVIFLSLRKYTQFAMLGLMVYFVRFYFLRDWNQIRAGVSFGFVLYSVQYIAKRDFLKFLFFWTMAVSFHVSSLLFFLLYFIGTIRKINIKRFLIALICAVLLKEFFVSFFLKTMFMSSGSLVPLTYIVGEFSYKRDIFGAIFLYKLGIAFSIILYENLLSKKIKYFFVFRNCYLFGVLINIAFADFSVLSGRLGTIFDTTEVVLLPGLVYLFKSKLLGYISLLVLIVALYYVNVVVRLGQTGFFGL